MVNKSIKNIIERLSSHLSDELYLKFKYGYLMGEKLNLKNPKTYNEKLQWLKINDRRVEQMQYVDKYEVRAYISETIGEEYLIPLVGVYEQVEQIDWESLPDKCVLKCTHGCGSNVIIDDKNKLDIKSSERKLKTWMEKNWYWYGREWPYRDLKPKIICEKFLQDNIVDYKVMCFNGEPKLIQIHQDRHNSDHTIDFYDINWKKTEIKRKNTPSSENILPQPKNLEEMLLLAKELSRNEIHVRVDFYEVSGRIYFGEKTYYSASGFSPFAKKANDDLLGSWIQLPNNEDQLPMNYLAR
ncbi:hypothetical protein BTR22_04330 [Alkalihalophilus pseudofirmus]|uniref:ATP-grasp fold amidoligase family protein n=1 Tax=Alkalihalophilus pseudofirmus TaxID=79885 RepID=UPI000951FC62|nr:hypothetical protein BTR22_04330 [Alkalihalophilus pseudofirmus]